MKQVSPDEALRGIYIDFEGGGSARRLANQLDLDLEDAIPCQYGIRPSLRPSRGPERQGLPGRRVRVSRPFLLR